MPITIKNEDRDVLGDALKQEEEARAYDPYQWQAAANGQGRNRVLAHGSGGDVAELIEPLPPIPRMVDLPEKDAEAIPVLNKFFADNSDLKPHAQTIIREVQEIQKNAPGFRRSDIFNLAIARVCKATGLPLAREAPLPAPLENSPLKIQSDELKRLESEAKKIRTDPGPDFASTRRALMETAPRSKRK